MMQEILRELGILTIGSFSIVGLIGYLGKNFIDWYIKNKNTEFQAKLNKDLSLFKASLDKESTKYQIQFSNLYVDRAKIIKEMYEHIVKLEIALFEYLNINSKKKDELLDLYNKLLEYYKINELVFEDNVSKKISELMSIIKGCWADYSAHLNYGDWEFLNKEQQKEKFQFSEVARNSFKKDLPIIKNELKKNFQELLGIIEK